MKANNLRMFLVFIATMLTINGALGAVVINEVMYNVPGSDTGKEWLEIYNNDVADPKDLTDWALLEGGTNHELSLVLGDIILEGGEYAVIADDADQFLLDHPNFLGTVFDSSFSLLNTGETINIINNLGASIGSELAYETLDSWGGAGDGTTTEKINSNIDDNTDDNWQPSISGGTPGADNNDAPVIDSIPLTTNSADGVTAVVDSTLTCNAQASDSDQDDLANLQITYAWTTTGSYDLSGFIANTLDLSQVSGETKSDTITCTATPNDGDIDGDPAAASITLSNSPPLITSNPIIVATEDVEYQYQVAASDPDFQDNDVLTYSFIGAVPSGMTINSTTGEITWTPSFDFVVHPDQIRDTQQITVEVRDDDPGDEGTDEQQFVITVTDTNQAPTIVSQPDETAIQGVASFSYTVVPADADGDSVTIDMGASNIDGTSLSDSWIEGTGLTLSGTPPSFGTFPLSLVVVDSLGLPSAAPQEFNLTVTPALEVIASEVMINGQLYDGTTPVEVNPGDQDIRITFSYRNNLDVVVGNVLITATSTNSLLTDFPQEFSDFSLLPGIITPSSEVVFDVPQAIGDSFTVTLGLEDETASGTAYQSPPFTINFNVNKSTGSVVLAEIENPVALADDELTCTKATDLTVQLTNNGDSTVQPRLLVYNQEAQVNVGDEIPTGEFDNSVFSTLPILRIVENYQDGNDDRILSGETESFTISVNASELESGNHTLFVYVTSPNSGQDQNSEAILLAKSSVDFTLGSCLKTEELEEVFTLSKNAQGVFADLLDVVDGEYRFLNEDRLDLGYTFTFPSFEQDSTNIISCNIAASMVSCEPPVSEGHGTSTLNVTIAEGTTGSSIGESFPVTVVSSLEITSLRLMNEEGNSEELGESDTSTITVKPSQKLTVNVTVKNNLDHPVTGVGVTLSVTVTADRPPFEIDSETEVNLEAGESKVVALNGDLGMLSAGEYDAEIKVTGKDFNDKSTVEDILNFQLTISREAAEIVFVSPTPSVTDDEIACATDTTINAALKNIGDNTEDDVIVTASGGNGYEQVRGLPNGFTITKNQATPQQVEFTVQAEKLNFGANEITIDASYRDRRMHTSEGVEITRNHCLEQLSPNNSTTLVIGDGVERQFSVTLAEDGSANDVQWTVTDTAGALIDSESGTTSYTFVQNTPGTYTVTVDVNAGDENPRSWTVQVTNVPLSQDFTISSFAPNDNLAAFSGFSIEKAGVGKIVFTVPVDLRDIVDIDNLVTLRNEADGSSKVAVNTSVAAGLANKAATVTLFQSMAGTSIWRANGFDPAASAFTECPNTVCQKQQSAAGTFVFTVPTFSTYWVRPEAAPTMGISPSTLSFDVTAGQTVNGTITVTNSGTHDQLTAVSTQLNISAKYSPTVTDALSSSLNAGQSDAFQFKFTVPADEPSGSRQIGTVRISSAEDTTKEIPVTINLQSLLDITSVKVDGKTTGKFKVDEVNEVEVEVKNKHTQDLEDVLVTVRLLNLNDEELEEEAKEFNLDAGKDDEVTVEFNLQNEEVDNENFVLEITAEGTAEDGATHTIIKTINASLDIEKHKIVVAKALLDSSTLQCQQRQANLQVTVQNIGKSDEDDVEVKVRNSALGLDQTKRLADDLEDFFSDDHEQRLLFNVNAESALVGTYPLTVEVYRDGDLEDSKEVPIEVKACPVQQPTAVQPVQPQPVQKEKEVIIDVASQKLAEELQKQLAARKAAAEQPQPATITSFRESGMYLPLLGVFVALVFLAVVLGLVVLVTRK